MDSFVIRCFPLFCWKPFAALCHDTMRISSFCCTKSGFAWTARKIYVVTGRRKIDTPWIPLGLCVLIGREKLLSLSKTRKYDLPLLQLLFLSHCRVQGMTISRAINWTMRNSIPVCCFNHFQIAAVVILRCYFQHSHFATLRSYLRTASFPLSPRSFLLSFVFDDFLQQRRNEAVATIN